jgi:hypothetical protein
MNNLDVHKDITGHALGAMTSCYVKCSTHTPAQRSARIGLVEKLHATIAGEYSTVLDPMAGTGEDAMLFSPTATVNDFDPPAYAELQTKFKGVTNYDLRTYRFEGKWDLVYLDFNTFTLNKFHKRLKEKGFCWRDITDNAFRVAQKFVIINDCSISGLRYFPHDSGPCYSKILGVPVVTHTDKWRPDIDAFFAALPAYYAGIYPDWELIQTEPYFSAAPTGNGATSYLLFRHR